MTKTFRETDIDRGTEREKNTKIDRERKAQRGEESKKERRLIKDIENV